MDEIDNLCALESRLGSSLERYYPGTWIGHDAIDLSTVTDRIRAKVECNDARAVDDACAILVADPHLPFGKAIKSRLARALRRHCEKIRDQDANRLAVLTARLLSLPFPPREVHDLCKLIRELGPVRIERVLELATPTHGKSIALLRVLQEHLARDGGRPESDQSPPGRSA